MTKFIKSEDDLLSAKELLHARALQRLRMRNEQFSFPLPRDRLEAIMDGDTDLRVVPEIWDEAPYKYVNH